MSDAENNDVENQRKGEKVNMISSDESQDVDKDSGSDKERKVDVPRTKKEAPKTPKKEKDKELLPKQKSKSNKKENVNSEDEQDSSDDKDADDDDEEDGERKLALLDQPLQISGARERKKVERLSISFHVPNKDKKTDIPEGDGTKLGDIPIVDLRLQKFKTDDLKCLHKLLFNRPGQFSEIKRNIRRFSGFTFKKDSPEFERKKNYLDKLTMTVVKQTCEFLDLERSGTKEDLINRIMEFLLKPKSSGKKVPVSKSRKTRSSSANSRSEKSKGGNAKKSRTRQSSKRGSKSKASVDDSKSESSDVEEGEDDEEGNASEEEKEKNIDDEEEEEESMEGTESEEDKKKKKPVKKENKSKASTVKEENKVNKKEEKKDEKKPPSRTSNKKLKELSDAESSDDEPLVKKAKQPPTDDELKVLVKKILEGANLEEITMKTVCKQVYAAYPDFDLSDRKEFIKSTVRSCPMSQAGVRMHLSYSSDTVKNCILQRESTIMEAGEKNASFSA